MSIDLNVLGHVAEITLNRPQAHNALSPAGTPQQVTATFKAEASRWKHIRSATQISFQ